jgi:hypothetical protein
MISIAQNLVFFILGIFFSSHANIQWFSTKISVVGTGLIFIVSFYWHIFYCFFFYIFLRKIPSIYCGHWCFVNGDLCNAYFGRKWCKGDIDKDWYIFIFITLSIRMHSWRFGPNCYVNDYQ